MSTLMICRQIEKISIENNEAIVISDKLNGLFENDRQRLDIEEFFKGKGLSFKIQAKEKIINPLDELKKYFGDGLIIK